MSKRMRRFTMNMLRAYARRSERRAEKRRRKRATPAFQAFDGSDSTDTMVHGLLVGDEVAWVRDVQCAIVNEEGADAVLREL